MRCAMAIEADHQEVDLRYIQILSVSISYTYIVYLYYIYIIYLSLSSVVNAIFCSKRPSSERFQNTTSSPAISTSRKLLLLGYRFLLRSCLILTMNFSLRRFAVHVWSRESYYIYYYML